MIVLYALSCLAWIGLELWIFYREHGGADRTKDQGTRRMNVLAVVAGIVVGSIFSTVPFLSIRGASTPRYFIAIIVIWAGWILRLWSVVTLGKYFRTTVMIHKHQTVIESGPYKLLRHPSYAGGLLMLTGVGIGMGNWLGLVLMELIAFAGFRKRMILEEKTLSQSLGKPYQDYMTRTHRLLPFLY
jgi:protein-S-isoprenylcysteine O-methyltransferase